VSDLVLNAKQDLSNFEAIFDHYFLPVHNYTLSKVGDVQAAEDIVSQTFLSAMESLARYKERGQFSAWLFTIARSKINDHFRKQKRMADITIQEIPASGADMLAKHIHIEEMQRLWGLIRTLPEEKQDLIRLRYAAKLSFKEIGGILRKSEGAVKKVLYRTLDDLKSEMEKYHV